jgi:hypothetical protein
MVVVSFDCLYRTRGCCQRLILWLGTSVCSHRWLCAGIVYPGLLLFANGGLPCCEVFDCSGPCGIVCAGSLMVASGGFNC